MKKIVLVLVIAFVLLLSSCGSSVLFKDYTISFESNGGTIIEDIELELEGWILEPIEPTKEGYIFDGWYSDSEFNNRFGFPSQAYSDLTLYAKWEEVKTDLELLYEAYQALEIVSETSEDIILPLEGMNSSIIIWKSCNLELITSEGIITRPDAIEGDTLVVLSAVLRLGDESLVKIFTVTVLGEEK